MIRKNGFATVLSCLLLAVLVQGVNAQEAGASKSELLRQAIVTPEQAIIPLPAEVVCGPQVLATEVSPSRRSVIIVRQTVPPVRDNNPLLPEDGAAGQARQKAFVQSGQVELQVLLWTEGSRRASVVWRRTANLETGASYLQGVKWLAGTETALVQIRNEPGPLLAPETAESSGDAKPAATTSLVRINARSGKSDVFTLEATAMVGLLASPNAPVAVLKTSSLRSLFVIRAAGAVQGPLPPAYNVQGGEYVQWRGWLADGKRLWGTLLGKAGADGKLPSRPVTLDVDTGTLADEKPGADVRATPAVMPMLPYTLERVSVIITREEAKRPALALWLEGSPVRKGERSLLAVGVDGRPGLTPLTTAVLYQQHGTLLVRPLVMMEASLFLAMRQKEFEAETLRRAASIAQTLKLYADLKGNGYLPTPGNLIQTLQTEYPFVEAESFNNPATGNPGFTPSYSALSLSDYPDPKTALMGYLAGPGGRAALYLDGHTTWEKTP